MVVNLVSKDFAQAQSSEEVQQGRIGQPKTRVIEVLAGGVPLTVFLTFVLHIGVLGSPSWLFDFVFRFLNPPQSRIKSTCSIFAGYQPNPQVSALVFAHVQICQPRSTVQLNSDCNVREPQET